MWRRDDGTRGFIIHNRGDERRVVRVSRHIIVDMLRGRRYRVVPLSWVFDNDDI